MNINPSAAAPIAGVGRAVAKGGTTDDQVNQARADQSKQTAPGGKSEGPDQLDAGDQTQDRGGDGRQVLDVFEHHEESGEGQEEQPEESLQEESTIDLESSDASDQDGKLDFQA